jgi:hypothetical protein
VLGRKPNDRSGWISAGPLSGSDVKKPDVRSVRDA